MAIRSARERLLQTVLYEVGGLAIAMPAYVAISGQSGGEGLVFLVALSVAVMIWSPLHNTLFDLWDWRWNARIASDRPQGLRLIHALTHETTTMIVTLPLVMWLGGYGFWQALLVDLGLSAAYAVWAYLFHVTYDRIRPVRSFREGLTA
jgi:uncharacterized membrane protein